MNMIAQLIGVIGITCFIISIQQAKKKNILLFQIGANALYFIEYALLSAFSAAFVNLISSIRSTIFFCDEKSNGRNSKRYLIIFSILIILVGIITYDGILSLIPIVISLFYTYSLWQSNLKLTRIVFIIAAFIWIYYNIMVGAYVSIIGNILEIISSTIALIRFKKEAL